MEGHNETLNPPLPCHAILPPATGINEGVHLSSLLRALETRGMTDAPRRALESGGVPYVPEEVRRLPGRMDRQADARDDGDFIPDHARGVADASRYWAIALREALAAAPATDEWQPPAWRPLDTYPRRSNDPVQALFWHERIGLMRGHIIDLPSGTKVHLAPQDKDVPGIFGHRDPRYRGLRCWMPVPPKPAAPTDL